MKNTELLCQALVSGLGVFGSKSLANYIMALASNALASSPTEVTLSPLYHYQYSSFGKMIARLCALCVGKNGDFDISLFDETIQSFIVKYNPSVLAGIAPRDVSVPDVKLSGRAKRHIVRTVLDVTPVPKPHSGCLEERRFVHCSNETIAGNKPIEIGYALSCLNSGFGYWSVPWSMVRCGLGQTYNEIGVEQVRLFAQKVQAAQAQVGQAGDENGLKQDLKSVQKAQTVQTEGVLVVNSADSGYGCAAFMAPLHAEKNLVNIVRLKNRTVWRADRRTKTGGANGVYGAGYALRTVDAVSKRKNAKTKEIAAQKASILSLEPDLVETYTTVTKKKKKEITVTLRQYKGMLLRNSGGQQMKDKPFDLVVVSLTDTATGEPCYQRPMYLAVCGQQRGEISLREAYETHYAHRYDIEPNNRFMKQHLLLDKYQTPVAHHFDVWLRIVQLAEWVLLAASEEVTSEPKKWQKSADKPADTNGRLSPTQTRHACTTLFLTFDAKPFSPQISNKGKGRTKGTVMTQKKKFPPVKKQKTLKKTATKPTIIENKT